MFLFKSRHKERNVHALIAQIVNRNCEQLSNLMDGPRADGRVNLTMPVQVVPLEGKRPVLDKAFGAVTKEFSGAGLSLVVTGPFDCKEVLIALKWADRVTVVKGQCRHQDPLGAGFWVVGVRLDEVVEGGRWPELAELTI